MTAAERRALLVLCLWLAASLAFDLSTAQHPRTVVEWLGPEFAREITESQEAAPPDSPIVRPSRAVEGPTAARPSSPPPYDLRGRLLLNRADSLHLIALRGVGPVTAGRILARRRQGPLRDEADLLAVHGIGPATLARLLPQISFAEADTLAGAPSP